MADKIEQKIALLESEKMILSTQLSRQKEANASMRTILNKLTNVISYRDKKILKSMDDLKSEITSLRSELKGNGELIND